MNIDIINHCIERLEHLHDQLEAAGELTQFDMANWANRAEAHDAPVEYEPGCGFAGCFAGWAAHQQWFAPYGWVSALVMKDRVAVPRFARNEVDLYGWNGMEVQAKLAVILDLPTRVINKIIMQDAYLKAKAITPRRVAERLRSLLRMGAEAFDRYYVRDIDDRVFERDAIARVQGETI